MGLKTLLVTTAGLGLGIFASPVSGVDEHKIRSEIKGKCEAVDGETRVLIQVRGLGAPEGNIRIQAYSNNPDEFLEKSMYLMRVEVEADEDRDICIPMPGPGQYAIALLHDINANGKADIFSEGFGFSRNPSLGLSKPDHEEVVVDVPEGVSTQMIEVNYVFGDGGEAKKKRRRTRRR